MLEPMQSSALLIGCGDLGARIGLDLAARGATVSAVRRNASLVPAPITGISADLTDTSHDLPPLDADLLVISLTAAGRDADGYRRTYLEGMQRALDTVRRPPQRAVLVSSTAVFGDQEGWVDESTEPQPTRPTAEVLLEAEHAFHAALPHGTIARMSGLYGNRLPRAVQQVRDGDNPDPHAWTNRAHRTDAARAVVHLLTQPAHPEPLYVVSDDEPCAAGELRSFVASELGLPWPPTGPERHGKRLRNRLLRETDFEFNYPDYRQGYHAALQEFGG